MGLLVLEGSKRFYKAKHGDAFKDTDQLYWSASFSIDIDELH